MGGWESTKTQDTILNTKLIISKVIPLISRFEFDFNNFLCNTYKYLNKIKFISPVGSTSYCFLDDIENKNITYGDIDYLVEFPFLDYRHPTYIKNPSTNIHDLRNKSIKIYKDIIIVFIETIKPHYIDLVDSIKSKGNFLIFKITPNQYVQVDIISTTPDTIEWAKGRFTPERGLKGFTMGMIYSSINNLFHINIGDRGTTVKIKDGKLVSGKYRKNIKHLVISKNYRTFWKDIFEWTCLQKNDLSQGYFIDPLLKKYPGLDPNNPKIIEQVKGLLGLIKSLDINGLLGNDIFPYKDSEEMIKVIKEECFNIIDKGRNNTKFLKAKTILAFNNKRKFEIDARKCLKILNTNFVI